VSDSERETQGYRFEIGDPVPPRWFRIAARLRGIALSGGYLGIIVGVLGRGSQLASDDAALSLSFGGGLLLALGMALSSSRDTPRMAARAVGLPVRGRWRVVNSPANRVPSHSHGHAQTFAIDLVFEPEAGAQPHVGGRAFRPPDDFPGFGQEIAAPADGRVVIVRDRSRDHRSRSTPNARSFLRLEGVVREAVGGARLLAGNQIVLDLGGGVYACLAHLKRGSATVKRGQQVRRGQVLGRCGNSGNSTEPHLHFQLMDHPRMLIAAGLPFAFTGIGGEVSPGHGRVPRSGDVVATTSYEPSVDRTLL